MSSEKYLSEIGGLYRDALSIMAERNKKYASVESPFANFQASAAKAGTTVEQGILTRLGDKEARLANLFKNGATFSDESVRDTFIDLLNYTNILYQWIHWGKYQYEVVSTMTQADVDSFDAEPEVNPAQNANVPFPYPGTPPAKPIYYDGVLSEKPQGSLFSKVSRVFRRGA